MPNPKYQRGANLEREVKKYYETLGYLATRSAGSHGIADVWATNGKELVLIQCKIGASQSKCEKILEEFLDELCTTITVFTIPVSVVVVVRMMGNEPVILARSKCVKQKDKTIKKSRASVRKIKRIL